MLFQCSKVLLKGLQFYLKFPQHTMTCKLNFTLTGDVNFVILLRLLGPRQENVFKKFLFIF